MWSKTFSAQHEYLDVAIRHAESIAQQWWDEQKQNDTPIWRLRASLTNRVQTATLHTTVNHSPAFIHTITHSGPICGLTPSEAAAGGYPLI